MGYFDIPKLIGSKGSKWSDALLLLCLLSYTVGLLAVRKATNVCFFLILLLAIAHFFCNRNGYRILPKDRERFLLALAFASPFIAVALTKLLRLEFSYRDLDAESRYLLAGFLLCFYIVKRVSFSRILGLTLPLALILTLIYAVLTPDVAGRWGGRYATSFVDPNVLGSYAAILTFMLVMTVSAHGQQPLPLKSVQFLGIGAGLLLVLLAASRGGWLASLALFVLWLLFRGRGNGKKLAATSVLLIVVATLGVLSVPGLKTRLVEPVSDVGHWVEGTNKSTASGQRLSIWKMSLYLVAERPLTGWGIPGARAELSNQTPPQGVDDVIKDSHGEYGGAHNDALQMMIQSGVWGLAAYLLLLLVPLGVFLRHRLRTTGDTRLACELGACLVLGVMVGGLTNELLSLKYLASFYSLTVAGLAAQVLAQQNQTSTDEVSLS